MASGGEYAVAQSGPETDWIDLVDASCGSATSEGMYFSDRLRKGENILKRMQPNQLGNPFEYFSVRGSAPPRVLQLPFYGFWDTQLMRRLQDQYGMTLEHLMLVQNLLSKSNVPLEEVFDARPHLGDHDRVPAVALAPGRSTLAGVLSPVLLFKLHGKLMLADLDDDPRGICDLKEYTNHHSNPDPNEPGSSTLARGGSLGRADISVLQYSTPPLSKDTEPVSVPRNLGLDGRCDEVIPIPCNTGIVGIAEKINTGADPADVSTDNMTGGTANAAGSPSLPRVNQSDTVTRTLGDTKIHVKQVGLQVSSVGSGSKLTGNGTSRVQTLFSTASAANNSGTDSSHSAETCDRSLIFKEAPKSVESTKVSRKRSSPANVLSGAGKCSPQVLKSKDTWEKKAATTSHASGGNAALINVGKGTDCEIVLSGKTGSLHVLESRSSSSQDGSLPTSDRIQLCATAVAKCKEDTKGGGKFAEHGEIGTDAEHRKEILVKTGDSSASGLGVGSKTSAEFADIHDEPTKSEATAVSRNPADKESRQTSKGNDGPRSWNAFQKSEDVNKGHVGDISKTGAKPAAKPAGLNSFDTSKSQSSNVLSGSESNSGEAPYKAVGGHSRWSSTSSQEDIVIESAPLDSNPNRSATSGARQPSFTKKSASQTSKSHSGKSNSDKHANKRGSKSKSSVKTPMKSTNSSHSTPKKSRSAESSNRAMESVRMNSIRLKSGSSLNLQEQESSAGGILKRSEPGMYTEGAGKSNKSISAAIAQSSTGASKNKHSSVSKLSATRVSLSSRLSSPPPEDKIDSKSSTTLSSSSISSNDGAEFSFRKRTISMKTGSTTTTDSATISADKFGSKSTNSAHVELGALVSPVNPSPIPQPNVRDPRLHSILNKVRGKGRHAGQKKSIPPSLLTVVSSPQKKLAPKGSSDHSNATRRVVTAPSAYETTASGSANKPKRIVNIPDLHTASGISFSPKGPAPAKPVPPQISKDEKTLLSPQIEKRKAARRVSRVKPSDKDHAVPTKGAIAKVPVALGAIMAGAGASDAAPIVMPSGPSWVQLPDVTSANTGLSGDAELPLSFGSGGRHGCSGSTLSLNLAPSRPDSISPSDSISLPNSISPADSSGGPARVVLSPADAISLPNSVSPMDCPTDMGDTLSTAPTPGISSNSHRAGLLGSVPHAVYDAAGIATTVSSPLFPMFDLSMPPPNVSGASVSSSSHSDPPGVALSRPVFLRAGAISPIVEGQTGFTPSYCPSVPLIPKPVQLGQHMVDKPPPPHAQPWGHEPYGGFYPPIPLPPFMAPRQPHSPSDWRQHGRPPLPFLQHGRRPLLTRSPGFQDGSAAFQGPQPFEARAHGSFFNNYYANDSMPYHSAAIPAPPRPSQPGFRGAPPGSGHIGLGEGHPEAWAFFPPF